ncbi:MAG: tRNA (adenosine(37)-N6)-dimethylallyltransferase MiaA [Acidobacteria bacterium]|nr:MAG: tRNA (adenosine(37)-N6)-dimethylallyltransferase MiaA [Acidobacteriota bacterium]
MERALSRPLVVAVFGPTAAGKTAFACALADRLPCRLISCDAFQVYRGLDAATAKPEGEERRHAWALVDWVEPDDPVDLARWVAAAERELERAWAAGRIPLVVGGTGMYLRGLLKGVAAAPRRDPALRERLERLEAVRGPGFLHRVLRRLDPPLAGRVAPRDLKRIVRGLEVRLATGRPLSAIQAGRWQGPDRWPVVRIGLDLPRDVLDERIGQRVRRFFHERDLVGEVERLRRRPGLGPGANALRGIGYAETLAWLEGRSEAGSLDELVELVARNTRRYARRQRTWFRREVPALWLDPRAPDAVDRAAAEIERARRP